MSTRLPAPAFENKITDMEHLPQRARELPHPVVMTNGVFDILHRGHVTYLAQARALGAAAAIVDEHLLAALRADQGADLGLRLAAENHLGRSVV